MSATWSVEHKPDQQPVGIAGARPVTRLVEATEWGVRWPAGGGLAESHESHGTGPEGRQKAALVAAMYRAEGARVVTRTITRTPWAVPS